MKIADVSSSIASPASVVAQREPEVDRPSLARISPHLVADPRPTGGSLTSFYRDTRFSRDKSPYKTALYLYSVQG